MEDIQHVQWKALPLKLIACVVTLLNEPHNFYSGKTKQLRKNETWVKLSIGLSLNDETNGLPVLFLVFSA